MLTSVRCLLVGFAQKQFTILKKNIEKNGGFVFDPRPASMFGRTPLPSDLTHIILERREFTMEALCKTLNTDDISPVVLNVHVSWIADSIKNSVRQLEEGYSIQIVNSTTQPGSEIIPTKRQRIAETISHHGGHRESFCDDSIDYSQIMCESWCESGTTMFKLLPILESSCVDCVAFDMDGTLIKTKSGNVFAKDENDWQIWDQSVVGKLRDLRAQGKRLVIISNQHGVKSGKISKASLQRKVDKILTALQVPVEFICSLGDDVFRKPNAGMWDFLSGFYSFSGATSIAMSIYVGDAAGRPAQTGFKKDFSDSDYKFALNVGAQVLG